MSRAQQLQRLMLIPVLGLSLALLLPTLLQAEPLSQPPIPHPLEGRDNCLLCHEAGVGGAPQVPEDHAGRTNDTCQTCHETAAAEEAATPTPVPGVPQVPHTLTGRANCLTCHKTGLGGARPVPDDHAGFTNDTCLNCHSVVPLPEATPAPTGPPTPTPLPVPTAITHPSAPGADSCLDCHKALDGRHEEISLEWENSIHAARNVTCADCHGGDPTTDDINASMNPAAGYIGVPPKPDIPGSCAACHADVDRMRAYDLPTDQFRKYQESIHGWQLFIKGDPKVATCYDCHDGHATKETNDPSSDVYPLNVPGLCARCHADEEFMKPYGIPTNQYDLFKDSIHGVVLLQEQNLRAPTCATCHGTHGAAPPGFQEVANVCGTCHGATQDYYLKSKHAQGASGAPKCVTCHGRHEVPLPTEELFLGSEPQHCRSCHALDSVAGKQALEIHQALADAAQALEEAELTVSQAAGRGMIVAPEKAKLQEAKTSLITARAAQHTVDLPTVKEKTDKSIAISSEVQESAEKAIAESVFRRQAMVVAVAVMTLVVVLLYMIKRQLDRELEASRSGK